MGKVIVFNNVSLDGFICSPDGDMSWAHNSDSEWQQFTDKNAQGGGILLFGRVTYELMASFWPTPNALKTFPIVAERMNGLPKIVVSRTLTEASWSNTRLVRGNLAAEVRALKRDAAMDIVIMGSGSIVSQLTEERLVDNYQVAICPVVIGKGKTMFETVTGRPRLRLISSRTFNNGNVFLDYEPLAE